MERFSEAHAGGKGRSNEFYSSIDIRADSAAPGAANCEIGAHNCKCDAPKCVGCYRKTATFLFTFCVSWSIGN